MANRDIDIPKGTDYIIKFEFLGANNQAYDFDDNDSLSIELSDIQDSYCCCSLEIDLTNYTNPVSIILPRNKLEIFTSNPIKYKLILHKENDIKLCLLMGYINLI